MSYAAPLQMPRWEWRTFAPSQAKLHDFLSGISNAEDQGFHEISLLCPRSMHDVQIRGEGIRLKWRKQIGPEGLELWDPILRSTFPCPVEVVLRLFEAWGLPTPVLSRSEYSKSQFLSEIVPQCPGLWAVEVDRQSQVFHLDGVRCEWIKLSADQIKLECFYVEHEDPVMTLQVIRRLGFQAQGNTSYSQGLKAALNFPMQH